jgi:hypothetical protein
MWSRCNVLGCRGSRVKLRRWAVSESRCDARLELSRDEALERSGVAEDFKKAWRRQMKVNHVGWVACEWGYTASETHFGLGELGLGPGFSFPIIFPQPRATPTSSKYFQTVVPLREYRWNSSICQVKGLQERSAGTAD